MISRSAQKEGVVYYEKCRQGAVVAASKKKKPLAADVPIESME